MVKFDLTKHAGKLQDLNRSPRTQSVSALSYFKTISQKVCNGKTPLISFFGNTLRSLHREPTQSLNV